MGILLVFDVTDERSFNNIRNWIKNTEQYATEGVNKILIGNKCDVHEKRMVSFDQAQALANEYNLPYMETSAKSGLKVDDAFLSLARDIKKRLIDSVGFDEKKKASVKLANEGRISGTVEKIKNSCCSGGGGLVVGSTTTTSTTAGNGRNPTSGNIKSTGGIASQNVSSPTSPSGSIGSSARPSSHGRNSAPSSPK